MIYDKNDADFEGKVQQVSNTKIYRIQQHRGQKIVLISIFVSIFQYGGQNLISSTEDGIAESNLKKGIYCIIWNVIEFSKIWMNKSKVGLYK